MSVKLLVLAGASALALFAPALAQDNQDGQFGTVKFETSCNETAQRRFERGMRYQHSFWYGPARDVFEEAAKADPQCGIAWWGAALSLLGNPHNAIPAPNVAPGAAAVEKAKAAGARTQDRKSTRLNSSH